jgi:hypothetical protein
VGNRVAIKFLNDALSNDPHFIKRFEHEAKASLAVTHPGAAQVLDTGRDAQTNELYIVFEYVEGEDLRERLIREGALNFHEARDIALRIGEVLAAAHERGIVHRDIKPENVRLRRDLGGTHVKVLDFGIAKFRPDADARLTAEGAIAGTPAYMAPEQVRAEPVDGRTDLYALGVLTFEMMSGLHPFRSMSAASLLVAHMTTPFPTLGSLVPSRACPALDAILGRACAKHPDERFASVKEFVAVLKALVPPAWAEVASSSSALAHVHQATPFPRETPGALATHRTAPSNVPALLLGLTAVALTVGILGLGLLGVSKAWSSLNQGASALCLGAEQYREELRALTTAQLEDRVRHSRILPPSAAAKQLSTLKTAAELGASERRTCTYRLMLMQSVVSEEAVLKTTPELWGHQRAVEELELLLLEMPLRKPWSVAQRKDIIAQIDQLFVANLKKEAPGDEDYWRRQYLGLELTCEATDEVLEHLKAQRPRSCLNLDPRPSNSTAPVNHAPTPAR